MLENSGLPEGVYDTVIVQLISTSKMRSHGNGANFASFVSISKSSIQKLSLDADALATKYCTEDNLQDIDMPTLKKEIGAITAKASEFSSLLLIQ